MTLQSCDRAVQLLPSLLLWARFMSWAGLIRFLIGFSLAIAVLVGGGYVAAQYLITQFTAPPPKPTFPNDKPAAKPKPVPKEENPALPKATASPQASLSALPASAPGSGYPAKVKQSGGLNLRDKPSRDGVRLGGLDFNDRVTVIEETPDKEWQKIQLDGGNLEGWIKSGYVERVNSAN